MKLFQYLDIETASYCNRRCPTCIRNSHPERERVAPWFDRDAYLPGEIVEEAVRQAKNLGFGGTVILSHFNEPLLDWRLPSLAEMVREYGLRAAIVTNGDHLSESLANRLDRVLDQITVSLYMDEPLKSQRAAWIRSLFSNTAVETLIQSTHLTTHYSPNSNLRQLINEHIDTTCTEPQLHCIINHRGQFLLCCEDVVGNFSLPTFPETSLEDYWYGAQHQAILQRLETEGGRRDYPYCSICPK